MSGEAMSLRLRLFLLILSPLLVVAVLLGVWRYQVAQATAQELFDRGLLAAGLAIARDVAISDGDALSPNARQLISDAGGGEVFYHVTGPGGIYVTGYAYPPAWRDAALEGQPQYAFASYRGEPVRVLRLSEVVSIDNLTGQSVVTVWQRMSDRNAFAAALAQRAAVLIAGLMAALAFVVWFGVAWGLRPLDDLQAAIRQRSPDDLSRIQRRVPVEVSGVVGTLNQLFGQVEGSIQAHQAFISDAAHQLRNPASAILSLAETLPGTQDAEARAAHERELIGAARRSAQLAQKLLSLERLRYDTQVRADPCDLGAVAEAVCADMAPEVLGRNVGFDFDRGTAALPLSGDPVLLSEALRNLVDNALEHGGPGLSHIAVSLQRAGDAAVLSVADDGRGLAPSEVDTALRRFGQVTPGVGSGLGLSIVDEVARKHGGAVEIDAQGQGTRVHLRFPLRQSEGA